MTNKRNESPYFYVCRTTAAACRSLAQSSAMLACDWRTFNYTVANTQWHQQRDCRDKSSTSRARQMRY